MIREHEAMGLALAQAAQGLGRTAPNPSVGAVVLGSDGRVLGEGHSAPAGGPHAEVRALRDAEARGHDVRGATMVVTLEPCCHHGRTPPCTMALLAAGIRRVVVGVRDPFSKVCGRGIAELAAAGVEVVEGVRAEDCARSVRGFARVQLVGLPEVTLKAAVSIDGRIATARGESQWITGEAARADGRGLRATHDGILVGIGTVLADDPRLTARDGSGREPVPVVLDGSLRIPEGSQLLRGPRRAVVICAEDAPERALEADVVRVSRGPDGRLDPAAALRAVAARGLHRVLVEGGGEVHRSLLQARLADTLVLYQAGVAIPGGRPWLGGPPLERLSDAVRMRLADTTRIGEDLRLTWELEHGCSPAW